MQGVGWRQAVGLGEHHIEADGSGPIGGELLYELGQHGARPGPLSHPLQRLLIDVDDAHGEAGIESARPDLLIAVENQRTQPRNRTRVPDAQGQCARDDRPQNEGIEETGTHTLCPNSA